MTTARRAPGSDACARLSTAGRAGAVASPLFFGDRASVAVALRSRGRAPPRPPRWPSRHRPRESPAGRGSWRRSDRSRSCRRSRGPVPRAGAPGWRSRRRSALQAGRVEPALARRSPPGSRASAGRSPARRARTALRRPARRRTRPQPAASPPAAPVIGTPRGQSERRQAPLSRATAAPSAPFCGPNTLAACSNGVRTSQSTVIRARPRPPAPAIARPPRARRPSSRSRRRRRARGRHRSPPLRRSAGRCRRSKRPRRHVPRVRPAPGRSPRQPRRGRSGRRRAAPAGRDLAPERIARGDGEDFAAEPAEQDLHRSLAAVGDGSEVRSGQAGAHQPAADRRGDLAARSAFP